MHGSASVEQLNGTQFADALRAGIYRVFRHSDQINRINVFPVPDGDTGTNLSMTLAAVLAELERKPRDHAGDTLTRAADAALDGARGNSGAILAQFLLGMGDSAGSLAHLDTAEFSAAASLGARYAREALSEPREGTLLTLLTDFAREATRLSASGVRDFRAMFAQIMTTLRHSLADTQQQLEVLRSAGVVDAGALGLVELLQGFTDYLRTGAIDVSAAPTHEPGEPMTATAPLGAQRYCVECMIAGSQLPVRQLREGLSSLGDSLVVGGTHARLRVHIHSNDPQRVFALAARFGAISNEKADDMLRQSASTHHARAQRVAVVSDSAADIPDVELERLNLHLVPVRVHFGSHSYLDKISLSPAQFHDELARNTEHPKTSQPPPGDFRRLYEFLASHYEAVVSISVSSKISGSYDAAHSAAARVNSDQVKVIDSGNASVGQGLIAMRCAEVAIAGGDLATVMAAAATTIAKTRSFALLHDLTFAVRGGRVSRTVKLLADVLRLGVILGNHADGRIGPRGVLLGRFRRRSRFAHWVSRRLDAHVDYRVLVAHANCEQQGQELLADLLHLRPNLRALPLLQLGTAIGVHGGPGTLIVGVQEVSADARL